MDAITRAFEIAAPYTSATITISMFSGTHYLLRSSKFKYIPLNISENSQQMDLTIKPLYKGETGYNTSNSVAYISTA